VHRRLLQAQGGGQEGGFVGQALRAGQFTPGVPGRLEDSGVARGQFEHGVVAVLFIQICPQMHRELAVLWWHVGAR